MTGTNFCASCTVGWVGVEPTTVKTIRFTVERLNRSAITPTLFFFLTKGKYWGSNPNQSSHSRSFYRWTILAAKKEDARCRTWTDTLLQSGF